MFPLPRAWTQGFPLSQKSESPSYQHDEKNKRNVTWYGCGCQGHYKPDCPNRPRQESTEEKTPKAPVKNGDKSNKKVAIEKKEAVAVQQTSSNKEPVLYQRSRGQANMLTGRVGDEIYPFLLNSRAMITVVSEEAVDEQLWDKMTQAPGC